MECFEFSFAEILSLYITGQTIVLGIAIVVVVELYCFGFDITMGGSMKKNVKHEFNEETFASVKKEMAKPRMASPQD